MYKRSEGKITGHKDTQLFVQTWEKPNAKGTIIITHGQGEHSECYHRLIDSLKEEQWNFIAWDLRGHGRSEGKRGYAEHFNDYILDYKIVLNHFLNSKHYFIHQPVILLSHSMGGLIQLRTLQDDPNLKVMGQVCSSPLLGVAVEVPKIKDLGAHLLYNFFPTITLGNELKNEDLTRDTDVLKEFEKDPYRHQNISSGVYLGFKENFSLAFENARNIQIPTLFQLAGKDVVVSTQSSQSFFEMIPTQNKQLKIYKDSHHEIYNDIDRNEVFNDLKLYLNQFVNKKDNYET